MLITDLITVFVISYVISLTRILRAKDHLNQMRHVPFHKIYTRFVLNKIMASDRRIP